MVPFLLIIKIPSKKIIAVVFACDLSWISTFSFRWDNVRTISATCPGIFSEALDQCWSSQICGGCWVWPRGCQGMQCMVWWLMLLWHASPARIPNGRPEPGLVVSRPKICESRWPIVFEQVWHYWHYCWGTECTMVMAPSSSATASCGPASIKWDHLDQIKCSTVQDLHKRMPLGRTTTLRNRQRQNVRAVCIAATFFLVDLLLGGSKF